MMFLRGDRDDEELPHATAQLPYRTTITPANFQPDPTTLCRYRYHFGVMLATNNAVHFTLYVSILLQSTLDTGKITAFGTFGCRKTLIDVSQIHK